MVDVDPEELEHLIERGHRRFGPVYFRPLCDPCTQCISVRVPVSSFVPSRSQRRVLRKGAHLSISYGPPRVDEERVELYRRWHAMREETRGWEPEASDYELYERTFCFPHPSAREITYREDGRLIGVGIVDEMPRAMSAVYCCYEPARAELSMGTFNVLTILEHALATGRQYVYLGYLVHDCASLSYKARFLPQETLVGRPGLYTPPQWTGAVKSSSADAKLRESVLIALRKVGP